MRLPPARRAPITRRATSGPCTTTTSTSPMPTAPTPATAAGSASYRDLLARHLVRPLQMDLWVMNADGSGQRQVTHLPGASFAPAFTPDGRRIIFASNWRDPRSRNFDLYLVNLDGSGL